MGSRKSKARQHTRRTAQQASVPPFVVPSLLPSDVMRAAGSLKRAAQKGLVDAVHQLCDLASHHPQSPPPVVDAADKGRPVQPLLWLTELGFSDGERMWRMKLSDEGWSVEDPGQVGRGRLPAVPPGLSRRYQWMLESWQKLRKAVREKAAQRKRRTVWDVTTTNDEWQTLTADQPWILGRYLRVADHEGQLVIAGIRGPRGGQPFELPWDKFIAGRFDPEAVAKRTLAFLHDTGLENIRTLLRQKK